MESRRVKIYKHYKPDRDYTLFHGDCKDFLKKLPSNTIDLTVTSPPYCMGKDYDKSTKVEDFASFHETILEEIVRVTKEGGSICWQVGYHVKKSVVVPLDFLIYNIFNKNENLFLRNRIIWTYGHGLHSKNRFSGRHEVILWFTKGNEYFFDLDGSEFHRNILVKNIIKVLKKASLAVILRGKILQMFGIFRM